MRDASRIAWFMAAVLSLCLIATAAPLQKGGQKGSKKKPPPAVEQVEFLQFMIYNTSNFSEAQLLSDHDPEKLYVDHTDPTNPDPCITAKIQGRGNVFAWLDKGSTAPDPDPDADPEHDLFSQCNRKVLADEDLQPNDYKGPRTYTLRLPADPGYGSCCSSLGLEPDSEDYCTLPLIDADEGDYGSQRIRTGRIFAKKVNPVDLDFLFYHTVGVDRRSFELQSEGALWVGGSGDYRSIETTAQDTFRLVEIGGPTLCSGFSFLLRIEFTRVEVPADS
jgi:hypothetical protein